MSIASEIIRLQNAKTSIKTAIENKGVTVSSSATLDAYDDYIDSIPTGGGGGIDWSVIGYNGTPQSIQDGYDYAVQIKNNWVTSTSYYRKFFNDYFLIYMPLVDTSNGTTFTQMFKQCYSLDTIPQLDTSNGTTFDSMFSLCQALKTIQQLNMSNSISVAYMFDNCYSLKTLGGFKNLGQAYLTTANANNINYSLILSKSSKLTHDSLMNVINNLYDIATAGVQQQQLILGSTNLAKLSAAEIQIATNKGWALS